MEKFGGGAIVEVGCGLGDIITSLRYPNRIGIDIDKNVIKAARMLHFAEGVKFKIGSFSDLRDMDIAVLIAVNFLHCIDNAECCELFKNVISMNNVKYIVVDDVSAPPYAYYHDYKEILYNFSYKLIEESKGYVALAHSRRKILYFVRE